MPERAVHIPMESADGFRNMAVDEYMLALCGSGRVDAALRFYQWDPPAVSLGYSQSFDMLDLASCSEQGIDAVRRITGGGALLHWEELTYCFVLRRDSVAGGARPRLTAGAVSRALVSGLAALGVEASARARSTAGGQVAGGQAAGGAIAGDVSGLCFMSGAENEIEARGRKLAGCAHKFTGEVFFSHGSVMTGRAHLRVVQLARPEGGASAERLTRRMEEKSTSLADLVAGVPGTGEMESAFKGAFESVFGLCFRPERISSAEAAVVNERSAEKRSAFAAAVRAAKETGGEN